MIRANGRRGASIAVLLVLACAVVLAISVAQWNDMRDHRDAVAVRSKARAEERDRTTQAVTSARQALSTAEADAKEYRASVAGRIGAARQVAAAADEVLLSQQ